MIEETHPDSGGIRTHPDAANALYGLLWGLNLLTQEEIQGFTSLSATRRHPPK